VIGPAAAALLKDTTRAQGGRVLSLPDQAVKVVELTRTLEELLVEPGPAS
jgi:hypothetical protein